MSTATTTIPETKSSSSAKSQSLFSINEEILAQILVGITLVTLIAGFLTELDEAVGTTAWIFYAVAYVAGGYYGVQAGWKSLLDWRIDVDLLMILAAVGAALVEQPFEGALLLFLFSLSNVLQTYALDRTRNAIRSLIKLRPHTALVRRNGGSETVFVEEIGVDEVLIIRPGEQIALDGIIVSGESAINQASLTGESLPVTKRVGESVLAGTLNETGGIDVRVTKTAENSTISRLIKLVEQARDEKAHTEHFIEKAEQYYAAGVILMTIAAIIIPLLFLGEAFQPTFYRAMTLMVAASPCALVISTPATVLSAIGNGARRGVLFKGGIHVEQAAALKVVAFDKTGTLTMGRPAVTDIVPVHDGLTADQLLALAAAVESRSEHPLAEAIVKAAEKKNVAFSEAVDFRSSTGKGVQGEVDGVTIFVGSLAFIQGFGSDVTPIWHEAEQLQTNGKTAVAVGRLVDQDQVDLLGVIALADQLRPNAREIVEKLRRSGIEHVVMLTGDNERVGRAIAHEVGLDEYHANLMPEDKLNLLKTMEEQYGPVAMVGDGVNDAPALASASVGIAMGAAGTDVALETADVVLMSDDLAMLPYMIGLSRQTRRVLVQNLVFATAVIAALIIAVLGVNLPLPMSVVGHEGSTVLVSLNGLRLLGYRG
ncbi:MAG: heavy metal translocating P-type ATPase [Ardenticatenaceae bacterium]|nr:heavy metal translocating P-type ATPase [Ardenticatenaceae bacterium]